MLKGPRPKFETPEQLCAVIDGYLESTVPVLYTLTGLALAIGTSRKTLENYGKKEGFREVVEEARLIVEHSYELRLMGKNYKGAIFALQNMGWDGKKASVVVNNRVNADPEKIMRDRGIPIPKIDTPDITER